MFEKITQRWRGPGGCARVLQIAFPLVLSTSAHTVQMFVDRMYLTRYSADAMAAALPAGCSIRRPEESGSLADQRQPCEAGGRFRADTPSGRGDGRFATS